MLKYLCVLQTAESIFTYHFFASSDILKEFVKEHLNQVWKIYKLGDVTEYWLYFIKETVDIENKNQSADVE